MRGYPKSKFGTGTEKMPDTDHIFDDSHERYLARKLGDFTGQDRRIAKLILDIGHVLTGPTSAANADRLAASLVAAEGAEITAQALERIVKRYRMGGR